MNEQGVKIAEGVYLSDIMGEEPKRGIASEDWDKVLKEIKDSLPEEEYKRVERILYLYSTRYF